MMVSGPSVWDGNLMAMGQASLKLIWGSIIPQLHPFYYIYDVWFYVLETSRVTIPSQVWTPSPLKPGGHLQLFESSCLTIGDSVGT